MDEAVNLEKEFRRRIGEHLRVIYGDAFSAGLIDRLVAEIGMGRNLQAPTPHSNNWSESDCLLITYGNTIKNDAEKPLHTLKRFLNNHLDGVISTVHILPFFPFSSDDGFAVMDYLEVNPALGDWSD
ncbi:MAG: alpha-amylase, partial [Pseudohongiellaceae bacterium]